MVKKEDIWQAQFTNNEQKKEQHESQPKKPGDNLGILEG